MGLIGTDAEGNEHSLVVITGERCRLVCLHKRTFTAAFTTGTDFHRVWCIIRNDKRLVVAAHSVCGADGRSNLQWTGISRVL